MKLPMNKIIGIREIKSSRLPQFVESMKKHGLINPITVRKSLNEDIYFVVDGKLRNEAARQLGWTEIECKVLPCIKLEIGLYGSVNNPEIFINDLKKRLETKLESEFQIEFHHY